jgi:hypothetical protein
VVQSEEFDVALGGIAGEFLGKGARGGFVEQRRKLG